MGQEEGRQEGLGNVCQPHFPGQGKQRESRRITAVLQGVRNVRRQEIFPRIDHESCRIGRQQGVDEGLQPVRVAVAGQARRKDEGMGPQESTIVRIFHDLDPGDVMAQPLTAGQEFQFIFVFILFIKPIDG